MRKWLKRYKEEGLKDLETRPGRRRKPIMDCSDEETVHRAIEQDRQSVNKFREAWQQSSGKDASYRPIRMAVSCRGFPCPVPEDSNIFGMTPGTTDTKASHREKA